MVGVASMWAMYALIVGLNWNFLVRLNGELSISF